MGTGLLMSVADLDGQAECRCLPGAGILAVARGEQDFAKAVERHGFTGLVTDLVAYGQSLSEAIGGLRVMAQPLVHGAKVVQRVGFTGTEADLPEYDQCLP